MISTDMGKAKKKNVSIIPCNHTDSNGKKCSHKSNRPDNLQRHTREKHLGYVFHCGTDNCFFWAASTNHVLQHKKSGHANHHGQADVEQIQQCRGCKYYFRDKAFCDLHMETCLVFNTFLVIIFKFLSENSFFCSKSKSY